MDSTTNSTGNNRVPTTRIVSDDNIVKRCCYEHDSCDSNNSISNICNSNSNSNMNSVAATTGTSMSVSNIVSLSTFFDSFSSIDEENRKISTSTPEEFSDTYSSCSSSASATVPASITPSSLSDDGCIRNGKQVFRRPAPSVCLVDLAGTSSCNNDGKHNVMSELSLASTLSVQVTEQCELRPRSCSIDSTGSSCQEHQRTSKQLLLSPWGHFVDLQIPEDDEVSYASTLPVVGATGSPFRKLRTTFLPGSLCAELQKQSLGSFCFGGVSNTSTGNAHANVPYLRGRRSTASRDWKAQRLSTLSSSLNRIPLSFSKRFRHTSTKEPFNESLEDFILMSPDVDEATVQLGSLSF
jgi:hypothetical protein